MRNWINKYQPKMRQRLLLALLIMAFLPALSIGVLAYQNARSTIEVRLYDEMNSVADLKQNEIVNWVEIIQSDVNLMADNFLNEEHITVILDENTSCIYSSSPTVKSFGISLISK